MLVSFEEAVALLKEEKNVAIPTETVYGLAGVATSVSAVKGIYKAKNRPADNPLICHFANLEMVSEYVELPTAALQMFEKFPEGGAFSCLVDLPKGSPLLAATAGLPSVIVRIPANDIAKKVIAEVGKPLAAPSANTSGTLSPVTAEMVERDLCEKIAGVLDGGKCEVGLESTILDLREEGFVKILRDGGMPRAVVQEIFSESEVIFVKKDSTPGAKYRHYSPVSKVETGRMQSAECRMQSEGCIVVDLEPEVADSMLYQAVYEADLKKPDLIYIFWKEGFSDAVKDRIVRMQSEECRMKNAECRV